MAHRKSPDNIQDYKEAVKTAERRLEVPPHRRRRSLALAETASTCRPSITSPVNPRRWVAAIRVYVTTDQIVHPWLRPSTGWFNARQSGTSVWVRRARTTVGRQVEL